MAAAIFEITSSAIGALAGILACAFLVVTIRSIFKGRAAYEANRAVTKPSLWATLRGDMRNGSAMSAGRTNHGLAIETRSGRLIPQQRLGADAVDDVIGRNA